MPRNRITEKGRLKRNRGRGHGEDYQGWVLPGDFPSPTGNTRLTQPGLNRSLVLFPPHETVLGYELIWRKHVTGDITDIREQYPLPLEITLEICERNGGGEPSPALVSYLKALLKPPDRRGQREPIVLKTNLCSLTVKKRQSHSGQNDF